jgi:hypothetical protein
MEEVIMLFMRRVSRWYLRIFSGSRPTAGLRRARGYSYQGQLKLPQNRDQARRQGHQAPAGSMHTQEIISIILETSLVSLESR